MVTYETNDKTIYIYMKSMNLRVAFFAQKMNNSKNDPFCPTLRAPVSKTIHLLKPLKLNGKNSWATLRLRNGFAQAWELNLG
jgi:hypothetical protein